VWLLRLAIVQCFLCVYPGLDAQQIQKHDVLLKFLSNITAIAGKDVKDSNTLVAIVLRGGQGIDGAPTDVRVLNFAFIAYPMFSPWVQSFMIAHSAHGLHEAGHCDAMSLKPPFLLQVAVRPSMMGGTLEEFDSMPSDNLAAELLQFPVGDLVGYILDYEETGDPMIVKVTRSTAEVPLLQKKRPRTCLDGLPTGNPLAKRARSGGRGRGRGRARGGPRGRAPGHGGRNQVGLGEAWALPDAADVAVPEDDEGDELSNFDLEEALAEMLDVQDANEEMGVDLEADEFGDGGLLEMLAELAKDDATDAIDILDAIQHDEDRPLDGPSAASSGQPSSGCAVVEEWLAQPEEGNGAASSSDAGPPPQPPQPPDLHFGNPDDRGGTPVCRRGVPIGKLQALKPGSASISVVCFMHKCKVLCSKNRYSLDTMAKWLALGEEPPLGATPAERVAIAREHQRRMALKPNDV
jgi:hypothetical protein